MGKNMGKRILWMIIGNVLLGLGCGCFRVAELGMDAYSSLVLGLSDLTGIQFGTTMLILNSMLLVVMLFLDIRHIGAGTIVNLVIIGYISDAVYWLIRDWIGYRPDGFPQSFFLIAALLLVGLGIALYTTPELGNSPYDDMGFIIEGRSKGRIKLHFARIISDMVCLVAGVIFALVSGQSIFRVVGIGTVCSAVLTGFMIGIFKKYLAVPLIWGRKKHGEEATD